jgi:hypothetical protein
MAFRVRQPNPDTRVAAASFDHLVGGQQMEVGVARGSGTPKMPVQLQQAARHYQFSQEAA